MLADELDYVVGVDPHRDTHALAIVHAATGVALFGVEVAASERGYAQALRLAERKAPGRRAWAVEGTGSYGAGLTRLLTKHGERVLEVGRTRRERRSHAKTDPLDALRAARGVLGEPKHASPRAAGELSDDPRRALTRSARKERGDAEADTQFRAHPTLSASSP
jgi:transposase